MNRPSAGPKHEGALRGSPSMKGRTSRARRGLRAAIGAAILATGCLALGETCTKSECGGDGIWIGVGIAIPADTARATLFRMQLCRNGVCAAPAELRLGSKGAGGTSEGFYSISLEPAGTCKGQLPVSGGVCARVWITTEFPHIEGDLYRLLVANADTGESLADIEQPAHFVVETAGNACNNMDDITCRHAEIKAAVY